MNKRQRQESANKLKATFNLLWDKAIEHNEKSGQENTVSYRDIVRIADAIRSEGHKILELDGLPDQIDTGFKFACAALDPNKARAKENLKQGLCGLQGGGGLALAAACLGQLMNPGIWATVVAFFVGGIPGGPLPIVGVAAGLVIAAGAVYAAFQKMSPSERSAKAHDCVMKGIDNWIEYGSKEKPVSHQDIQDFVSQNAARHELSPRDYQASFSLMMNVANADGILLEAERLVVSLFLAGNEVEKRLNRSEAIEKIKQLGTTKASEIIDWCFQVAQADGVFHSKEIEVLKRYCQSLGVDFETKAKAYGIQSVPV
ncbi:MAG: TerB family tellurite resistance protein [Cyanobacteria bacterium J06621_11]